MTHDFIDGILYTADDLNTIITSRGYIGTLSNPVTSDDLNSIIGPGNFHQGEYINSKILNKKLPVQKVSSLVNAASQSYMGTFSRSSTATYFDADGVLQTASVDQPRWDYDPATGSLKGLLIEESRTNLLPYSEDFSQWTLTNVTLSSGQSSPTLGINAVHLVDTNDTSSQEHFLSYDIGQNIGNCSFSIYAAPAELEYVALSVRSADDTRYDTCVVSLVDGTVTYIQEASGPLSVKPVALKNGWFRITLTANYSSTSQSVHIGLADPSNSTSTYGGNVYTGSGGNGIYIGGAQIEKASFPTSYIPTSGSAVTRAADDLSISDLSPFDFSRGTFEAVVESPYIHEVVLLADNTVNSVIMELNTNNFRSNIRADITTANAPVIGKNKAAVSFYNDTQRQCLNANTVVSGSSSSPNLPTNLRIGSWDANSYFLNGHIKSLKYYPYAMTDTQLQAATA